MICSARWETNGVAKIVIKNVEAGIKLISGFWNPNGLKKSFPKILGLVSIILIYT